MSDAIAAPSDAPATPSPVPAPVAASVAAPAAPSVSAAPTAPVVAPSVVSPAPAASSPAAQSDDGKEPHWLPDRLRRAEDAARKSLLKDLGVEDPKDVKKALADYKAKVEAEKSEIQKALERAQAAESAAKERDVYKAKVESWAMAEFNALTDAQKAAVDALAGDDPLKRANAIEVLRPTWVAQAAAAAAVASAAAPVAPVAAPAPPVPPPIPAPANIAPPVAAPKPTAQQTAWEKFHQIEKEQGAVAASLFYQFNGRDIEMSRPVA